MLHSTDLRDPLAAYRERAMYLMSIAAVVVLFPLVVNNFVWERYALGSAIGAVVAMLAVDAWVVRGGRNPPIPYSFLLLPATAAIGISLKEQGIIGVLWCYPAILFFYFVLRRAAATTCSLLLVTAAAMMMEAYIGIGVSVRFAMSAILTIVVVNIILNIVGDLHKRLIEQAITDPLTGAFNRRHMDERLDEVMLRSGRTGLPAALLMVDIDHFKRINDEAGHEAGDAVLKGVVEIIRKRARRSDLLFRVGGEEFLVLLPDTGEHDALKVAEALRATIADAPMYAKPVTVSIGVAALDARDTIDTWIKRADDALYDAKGAGRDRVMSRPVPEAAPAELVED